MNDLFENLTIGGETLKAQVELDDTLKTLSQSCDYNFNGESTFLVPSMIPPSNFKVGLIVGGSGTGKSSLLKHFGEISSHTWSPSKAVASQVDPTILMKLGFASIPSLCRPYHVLSEGEKHRADLAAALVNGAQVVDEFTSTVHRDLARSICIGLRKYIDKNDDVQITLATCHLDVTEWLEPDWIFNTNTGKLTEGRLERRPIKLEIYPCTTQMWPHFSKHHYLTGEISKGARCWIGVIEDIPCCFGSSIPLPHPQFKAYREHRLVVHPDYQGMSLGLKLSDLVASHHISSGIRYFSKTAHPALGFYREKSKLWKATTKNLRLREDYVTRVKHTRFSEKLKPIHATRLCFSHEYIG
tara:strand:+ start:470 stop:1537 length:1068 start_codon:yes stop_codon:yes gene_type:complete